jgi:putative ABC transport system permease protein
VILRFLPLVWANLERKPLRLVFTFFSIVVAFMLFGVLEALRFGFFGGVEAAGDDRLMTMHRMSLIQELPASYVGKVQAVDGIESVHAQAWFGGWFQNERNQLATFAVDQDTLFEVYPEIVLPPEQKQAWLADRTGVIVGRAVAAQFGWQVGQRLPLQQSIPYKQGDNTWEVTVRGIYDQKGADNRGLFLHLDYLNESRSRGRDNIGWIVSTIADPADAPRIAAAIDALFANSRAETKTSTEKAWAGEFARQVGDIGAILTAVAFAVFFTMLLVTANTIAQSVRERVGELGVMKTLGFTHGGVTAMVLAESLLLTLAGGLVGIGLANLLVAGLRPMLSTLVPLFALPGRAIGVALALIVLLGVFAGLLPALRARRLKVVEALRAI